MILILIHLIIIVNKNLIFNYNNMLQLINLKENYLKLMIIQINFTFNNKKIINYMNKIFRLIIINQIENKINTIMFNHKVDLCLSNNNNNKIIYHQHIYLNKIYLILLMKPILMGKNILEKKLMGKKKVQEDYIIKKEVIMMGNGKMIELMVQV